MSLGWQTESAILPSKSKPINVDGKSLLHLKAIVYDKEKQIQTTDKYIKNKYKTNNNNKHVDIFEKKNSGIDERNKKDSLLSGNKTNTDNNNSIIEASLKVKAKLYEDINNGKISNKNTPFLVDFKSKRKHDELNVDTNNKESIEKINESSKVNVVNADIIKNNVSDDSIEIEDSFGRTRVVSKSSDEYLQYIISNKTKKYKETIEQSKQYVIDDNNHNNNNQWNWSNGNNESHQDHVNDTIINKSYEEYIQDNINSITKNITNDSKIKTMWEKTLDSSAREFIDEIHKDVEDKRNGNIKVDNNISEDRKELLKRKLEERKKLLTNNL